MDPKESKLAIPKMMTGDQSQNMVYFWISDYTLDTAGEVYHKVNKLRFTFNAWEKNCLLYTSPSPRDATLSRMPSSA